MGAELLETSYLLLIPGILKSVDASATLSEKDKLSIRAFLDPKSTHPRLPGTGADDPGQSE